MIMDDNGISNKGSIFTKGTLMVGTAAGVALPTVYAKYRVDDMENGCDHDQEICRVLISSLEYG